MWETVLDAEEDRSARKRRSEPIARGRPSAAQTNLHLNINIDLKNLLIIERFVHAIFTLDNNLKINCCDSHF